MANSITSNSTPGPQNPAVENATIFSTWLQPKQLSDGNGAGTIMGQGPNDLLAFFSNYPTPGQVAPITQPAGAGQAALTRGYAGGVIATINSATESPASGGVNPNTTAEAGLATLVNTTSIFQVTAGDMIYVNKPTAQAGLGMGNVRVSATNQPGVTFSNFTAATITPTASQSYGVVAIRGLGNLSAVLSPAAVQPTTITEQQFAVPGLRAGAKALVQVSKPTAQAGLDIVGCRAVSNNVLGITFANLTAATITPTASETYTVLETAGIDAVNNFLVMQTLQTPGSVANAVTAEQGLTVTGLATTDTIVGVSKPTAQAGLFIGGWRVSAASSLGLTFGNVTGVTITPTASQVYAVTVWRPAPAAPLIVYNQVLTPVSVAANTTAEQTFTVTGLVVGSAVWVNKPSITQGLGIVGVRVSAANTLAINYGNCTANAIVPPSEAYVIGNFQVALPDVGGTWMQLASPTSQNQSILDNSMRAALVGLNLMAGA